MTKRFCIIALLNFLGVVCFAQSQLLQITSPPDQTVVLPGQTVTITVAADPSVTEIGIVGQNPLGFSQNTVGPLQFTLTIPANIAFDGYQVSASGLAATGEDTVSDPITLFVVPPFGFNKIRTEPSVLRFRSPGEIMPLRVVAQLFNGSTADVTHSRGTFYSSRDTSVATVDARGLVTAVAPGSTFITIFASSAQVSVNVKVPTPPAQNTDTTPPTTQVSASPGANAAGWNNSDVTLQFAATDNPGGSGVKSISVATSGAQTGQTSFPGSSATVSINAEGTTTVTYFAVDNAGNQEPAKSLVIKLDKTPPAIAGLPVSCSLWPPNGNMVTVGTVSASDALSGLASFNVSAISSEPDDPKDGPDIAITGATPGPQTIALRAQRLGTGTGRIYTITAKASDIAGNVTTTNAACVVPHDQGQ
jgi:archaellum component FlaF (FlaF/FlaG flagellin family)